MLRKGWKDPQEKLELTLADRLYDELTVMAVKEEAPTAASTFSGFKDLVSVHIGAQTPFDDFSVSKVFLECLHEQSLFVEFNFDIGPQVDLRRCNILVRNMTMAFILSCAHTSTDNKVVLDVVFHLD